MIVYDLACRNDHVFEAWFRDGAAFEAQAKGRKILCPECGDSRVRKAPMAPRIAKGAQAEESATKMVAPPAGPPAEALAALRKLRRAVESSCD